MSNSNTSSKKDMGTAILFILLGILLCILNVSLLTMLARIIGIAGAAIGAYMIFLFFRESASDNATLFYGIPLLVVGGLLIFSPESVIAVLPVLAGIVLTFFGIVQLKKSFVLKDNGFPRWNLGLVAAILMMIFGAVLFLQPIQTLSFIMQLIGAGFIVAGIFQLISSALIRRYDRPQDE